MIKAEPQALAISHPVGGFFSNANGWRLVGEENQKELNPIGLQVFETRTDVRPSCLREASAKQGGGFVLNSALQKRQHYYALLRTVIPVGSETSEFSRNTNG